MNRYAKKERKKHNGNLITFLFNANYVGQKSNRFRNNNKSSYTPCTEGSRPTFPILFFILKSIFLFSSSRLASLAHSVRRNITGFRLWRYQSSNFQKPPSIFKFTFSKCFFFLLQFSDFIRGPSFRKFGGFSDGLYTYTFNGKLPRKKSARK